MKPHHKIFLTSLALLLVVINAKCQTKMTEGRIEYSFTYPDSVKLQPYDSIWADKNIIRIKGKMERVDIIKDGNICIVYIYDEKNHREITYYPYSRSEEHT